MIVRLFLTSVAPGDLDEAVRIFDEDVRPAFESQAGCKGIELLTALQTNVAGLIETCAISRWHALESMERALEQPEVQRSRVRFLELLRREPVIKIYQAHG